MEKPANDAAWCDGTGGGAETPYKIMMHSVGTEPIFSRLTSNDCIVSIQQTKTHTKKVTFTY